VAKSPSEQIRTFLASLPRHKRPMYETFFNRGGQITLYDKYGEVSNTIPDKTVKKGDKDEK
jgi:hypothetical protein